MEGEGIDVVQWQWCDEDFVVFVEVGVYQCFVL